jgi:hypothetical protein
MPCRLAAPTAESTLLHERARRWTALRAVWLEGLRLTRRIRHRCAAPQPPTGPLPNVQSDFTETVLPKAPAAGAGADLREIAFTNAQWLFFRTQPARFESSRSPTGRAANGLATRASPIGLRRESMYGGRQGRDLEPGPDMLDALGDFGLGRSADWPRFFCILAIRFTPTTSASRWAGRLSGTALPRHSRRRPRCRPTSPLAWSGLSARYGPQRAARRRRSSIHGD